jgi:hypothetical protein
MKFARTTLDHKYAAKKQDENKIKVINNLFVLLLNNVVGIIRNEKIKPT